MGVLLVVLLIVGFAAGGQVARGGGVVVQNLTVNVDNGDPAEVKGAVLSALGEAVGRRTGL